jgi:hypothetical protein
MQTTGALWFKSPKPIGNPMIPASWNWTLEKNALPYTPDTPPDYLWRSNGFIFWGDDVYSDAEASGVWKCKYEDLLDESKFEELFTSYPNGTTRGMFGVNAGEQSDEMIHSYGYGGPFLICTINGDKYKVIIIDGVPLARAFMPIYPKTNGWYLANIWGDEEFNVLMRGKYSDDSFKPSLIFRVVK